MDLVDKAKIRLEHWISHNDQHFQEYKDFAEQLESAGKTESAGHIRELMDHAARSAECMKKALRSLG